MILHDAVLRALARETAHTTVAARKIALSEDRRAARERPVQGAAMAPTTTAPARMLSAPPSA